MISTRISLKFISEITVSDISNTDIFFFVFKLRLGELSDFFYLSEILL